MIKGLFAVLAKVSQDIPIINRKFRFIPLTKLRLILKNAFFDLLFDTLL